MSIVLTVSVWKKPQMQRRLCPDSIRFKPKLFLGLLFCNVYYQYLLEINWSESVNCHAALARERL